MKISSTLFPILLVVCLTHSAPISKESKEDDEKVTINAEFFPDSLSVYTAEHEIVEILVPLNSLNFDEDSDENSDSDEDDGLTVFFVEADLKENGEKIDQGLYVLKEGKAKKLLDNGRGAAASNDDSKQVFFGASDGLYVYNEKENKAEKYGTLTDNVIGIAKENGTELIYILTADKVVYKVTDEGTVKTKVDEIQNAQQIVLDFLGNVYFYNEKKEVFIYNGHEVKKIDGLPENPSSLTLVKPPFIIEDGVPIIIDNKSYVAYVNGSSELTDFEFEVKPSAYGMEATLIQYYAYEKKIYEYNILAIILSDVLDELKTFLSDKKDTIESIATRSRSDLGTRA